MTTVLFGRTQVIGSEAVAEAGMGTEVTSQRFELTVPPLPAEESDWLDCHCCGVPNKVRQGGCSGCGAAVVPSPGGSGHPPSAAPTVWLSTEFLDADARYELAQVLCRQTARAVAGSA